MTERISKLIWDKEVDVQNLLICITGVLAADGHLQLAAVHPRL